MKLPTAKLRKATVKRMRAQGGLSEGQQAPAPKRPSVRVSPPSEHREPPAIPKMDLTADIPPEGVRVERATDEPQMPAKPTLPEDKQKGKEN